MNTTLTHNLQKIRELTLEKIGTLLTEQEAQIKQALLDFIGSEDTQNIESILDSLWEEADAIKDEIHDARRKTENLYNKSDEVLSLVTDVSDDIDIVLEKVEALTGTINQEKEKLTQEAA